MIPRFQQSPFRKFIFKSAKIGLLVEAICFAGSYAVYHRMNTNREFRFWMHENCPWALDYFYKIGELVGEDKTRQIDQNIWKQSKDK